MKISDNDPDNSDVYEENLDSSNNSKDIIGLANNVLDKDGVRYSLVAWFVGSPFK